MKLQDTSSFKNFTGKEDIQMGLDLENTSSIMNLLRNNIYSDVVQSVVREIYSNAVDAHSKINSTDNIEIDLVEDGGKTLFSVRDFGLSMDKEAIANTYSKMGKSTKRDSNVEMGGWGLGCKSPLAYTDHFWIETNTIEDGSNIYRKWVQYIDVSKVGKITLLEEVINPSNFRRGTKVIVPFESKDVQKVIESLDLYLTYTKSNFIVLNKEIKEQLTLETPPYDYYGSNWAKLFLSRLSSGKTIKRHVIIEGIPYKLDLKLVYTFIRNSGKNLDYLLKNNKPKDLNELLNKEYFICYLNCLENFSFELKVGIGSLDLSASRESLQYTDKTCIEIYKNLYRMYCEFYCYLKMDLINYPNFSKAAINFKKYPQEFKNAFSKHLKWQPHNLLFTKSYYFFDKAPEHEYKIYKLDTRYSDKHNKYIEVIKNVFTDYAYFGDYEFIICDNDSKYQNYTKYLKHYILKHHKESRFHIKIICVKSEDIKCLNKIITDGLTFIKLSDLINEYNIDNPYVKVERKSNETIKLFKLIENEERSRAQGLNKYTKEVEIKKDDINIKYYLSLEELENIPKHLDFYNEGTNNKNCYKLIERMFSYLKSKNIENSIYIIPKASRNFNNEYWINFIDVLKEDYEKYNFVFNKIKIALFQFEYTRIHFPCFLNFNFCSFENNSKFTYIKKMYFEACNILKDNEGALKFLELINIDIYYMKYQLGQRYTREFDEYDVEVMVRSECLDYYNLLNEYQDQLPFLKFYNNYHSNDINIDNPFYIEYINVFEREKNLFIKQEPQEVISQDSDFHKLYKKYLGSSLV